MILQALSPGRAEANSSLPGPGKHCPEGPRLQCLLVTWYAGAWLGTRQCDECRFYLLAFLVFLFCGFGFLWGLNVKMVLLVAKDGQAPGTTLLAGDLGQQGTSILPALRGLCRMFVQSQEIM